VGHDRLVGQGTLEFHVWLSTVDAPNRPHLLDLDLDLDPPDGWDPAKVRRRLSRKDDPGRDLADHPGSAADALAEPGP
jgi:bifunctional non-homologous end joining protein LigD